MRRPPVPILGTLLDGDLTSLAIRDGRGPTGARWLASLPWDAMAQHTLVVGATGTGKTITLLRMVAAVLAAARANGERVRVIYADAKGLGRAERDNFVTIVERHGLTVHHWPQQPLDGMSGTRAEVRERLSGLFDAGESAFHHAEATTMLDLALGAGELPQTLEELIHRTRPGITASLYEAEGTEQALAQQAQAKAFTQPQWQALYLRLRALHATLGQRLDAGPFSPRLDEVEAAWLSLPGTTAGQTAGDAAAWILALIAELAGRADGSTRTLVILDEFSAVAARTGVAAAGLAERTRSAGVALAFGAQSVSSLGEHAERLMANCGTDILHRSPLPQALLELAGTTAVWEDLHETGPAGMRIPTGGRRQQTYRIDPDLIRTLPAGQVVLVRNGRWAQVAVALPSALTGPSPAPH